MTCKCVHGVRTVSNTRALIIPSWALLPAVSRAYDEDLSHRLGDGLIH